jgi:hemerythrin superfamily protein
MAQRQTHDDVVKVLTRDHREVEQMFRRLEQGKVKGKARKDLVDQSIIELVRHSVAEEEFLYPAFRKHVTNGDKVADRELEQHHEAERLMARLDHTDPTDGDYDKLLTELMADVRQHIKEEERDLLPRLAKACTKEELVELGEKITAAKAAGPTRPHPLAPDNPTAKMLLNPGAGLVDRMRDALTKRGTENH